MSEQNAFTLNEFGERNRLSRTGIYRQINAGKLTAKKAGGKTIITADEERRWLESLPTLNPQAA